MAGKEEVDYRTVVVKKPWGHEYLMYENGIVGVWFLNIKKGQRTSMHCHPKKKTGLIILSGEAVLSFLSDSATIKPLSKMMIREGFFHSTTAVSEGGASIIEIETPVNKHDLVRMDDEYGREEKGYEGGDNFLPLTPDCLHLEEPVPGKKFTHQLAGCTLSVEHAATTAALKNRPAGELAVILNGGLFSKSGEPVVRPGDVVNPDTLTRMAERFECPKGASFLSIRKP